MCDANSRRIDLNRSFRFSGSGGKIGTEVAGTAYRPRGIDMVSESGTAWERGGNEVDIIMYVIYSLRAVLALFTNC